MTGAHGGRLLAVSDLHVNHPENRALVQAMRAERDEDWLIVAGDVSDDLDDVDWALGHLAKRFAKVIWTPGNHELWSASEAPGLRGEQRYKRLLEICAKHGVLTPEDAYPVWEGAGGPLTIAPLFLLYDYSFSRNIASSPAQALALAHRAGVVCTDEFLLHPDPYETRAEWCHERVRASEVRLTACGDEALAIVTHFPLTEAPTKVLLHPEFAQWCGTTLTADWHLRFNVAVVVYGHLHIPRTTFEDGVRFEEVSLGYPRERRRRSSAASLRTVAPIGAPA